jgi:predicted ATPase
MITQIEIDGFKTFKDFKVELAPFQVIVGPNGSGKSNLFDALRLLSRLAETDLLTAFQGLRGDADEVFTKLPNERTVDLMRLAVEMLVDRKVQDDLGETAILKYTRLRYELEIQLRIDEYGLERPYIARETLKSIPQIGDKWYKKYNPSFHNNDLTLLSSEQVLFIFTELTTVSAFKLYDGSSEEEIKKLMIHLPREGQSTQRLFSLEAVQRTVLSSVNIAEFPHAFAAREELRSLRFFHFNPEALRQPSSTKAPRILSPDGSNLPTALARIQAEDKFAFHMISFDVANLVPGVLDIVVEQDKPTDRYLVRAETADKRSFSAQVLSDGTLRLLALATLRNDPQFHGVLCIEEPENRVQPLYLHRIAQLLREMTTDFNDPEQVDEPLRQVLVTTHSPLFISQPEVIDSLLLATMPTYIQGKSAPPINVTRMSPVITPNALSHVEADGDREIALEAYTIDMVRKYLDSDTLDEAQEHLKEARTNLHN